MPPLDVGPLRSGAVRLTVLSGPKYRFAGAFESYKDDADSPFAESLALGLDAAETWSHLTDQMETVLRRVVSEFGPVPASLDVNLERLCGWHQEIFGAAFPDHAGKTRRTRPGGYDHVWFGASVGTSRSRRFRQLRGTHPNRIHGHLRRACGEFNTDALALLNSPGAPTLREATYLAARLYCKILRIHPWPDGNLRAAYVALQAALARLDLPAIAFQDLTAHDDAIGKAFQGDNRPYEQLSFLIENIIRARVDSET